MFRNNEYSLIDKNESPYGLYKYINIHDFHENIIIIFYKTFTNAIVAFASSLLIWCDPF